MNILLSHKGQKTFRAGPKHREKIGITKDNLLCFIVATSMRKERFQNSEYDLCYAFVRYIQLKVQLKGKGQH